MFRVYTHHPTYKPIVNIWAAEFQAYEMSTVFQILQKRNRVLLLFEPHLSKSTKTLLMYMVVHYDRKALK